MTSARLSILGVLAAVAAAAVVSALATGLPSRPADFQGALAALAKGEWARAETIAGQITASGAPGAERAWLIVAAARRRRKQFRRAETAYRKFLASCHRQSERHYAMAQIRACRRDADPPPAPAPLSQRLTAEQRKALAHIADRHQRYTESTEHFVVQAYNPAVAKLVAAQAEVALRRIGDVLAAGQAYPHSVDVYVWPNLQEYHKNVTDASEWSGGAFILKPGPDGGWIRRIDLTQWDADGKFDVAMLDRVLPHEMCHLVLAEYFGDAQCPLALNEGLAMMAEAGVENRRVLLAGAALGGKRGIPLSRLLMMKRCGAKNADVFYAEAFSLTAYLHARLTRTEFREMLAHVKAGCSLAAAIQRALYVPPDKQFVERLERAWVAEAVRQSQFLEALQIRHADAF